MKSPGIGQHKGNQLTLHEAANAIPWGNGNALNAQGGTSPPPPVSVRNEPWLLPHRLQINSRWKEYENLREDWFLPCNNLTHKVIHWLWTYYKNDEEIIDRLKAEMEKMKAINQGGGNDGVKI